MSLRDSLAAAGLNVKTVTGWGTRGGKWTMGQPVGVMHHHTALPVPFPVDRLYGDLLKCNINTKPDGTVWLIAQGACNFSSGPGSSVVLDEVRVGTPPTQNALERNLTDDTNGNPWFFNFENDHAGTGGPMPQVQHDAIVTATGVVNDHYGLTAGNVVSHAEWTRRKRDPYWNGSLRAIDEIRQALEDDMASPKDWDRDDWNAFKDQAGWGMYPGRAKDQGGRSAWQTLNDILRNTVDIEALVTEAPDTELTRFAKAVNDELARRAQG